MIPELVTRLLSTGALAGTRGSLTLLGLALAGRFELFGAVEGAPQAWMTSDVGLALLFALVVLEELAEQDEDLQAMFDVFAYALRGGAGALAGASLQATASELGDVTLPDWSAALIGAGAATATHHLRAKLHVQLEGLGDGVLSPRTWLAWLELGGVLGLFVAVVFAPAIALAFVVLASCAGALVLLSKRAAERRLLRAACPSCGYRARVEANRCAGCKGPLTVRRWLS